MLPFETRYAECYKPHAERQANRGIHQLAVSLSNNSALDTPSLDLFIWAVLCNRRELSMLMWERTKEKVGSFMF